MQGRPRKRRGKAPSKFAKRLILEAQGNRCRYCGLEFILDNPCFDHVLPFSSSHNNRFSNYVAACSECNALKQAFIFESIEAATRYIRDARLRRGSPLFEIVETRPIINYCPVCGGAFEPEGLKKYCSARCRNRQYRVERHEHHLVADAQSKRAGEACSDETAAFVHRAMNRVFKANLDQMLGK